MDSWGSLRRWRYGTLQSVGFGFVAGALEATNLAASSLLSLSWHQALVLGLLGVVIMGAVGALLGAVAGLPVQALHRAESRVSTTLSRHLALTVLLITGFYLWQMSWRLAAEGASVGGWGALAAMPLGFAGVAFFNARYWLRKAELGRPASIGWLLVSGLGAVLVVGGTSVTWALRDPGGAYALEGDPNLVLITVDGLRHDDALEGTLPALDDLAAGGVRFTNAVTPTGETRAANATVLVGLHPLRHKVLRDRDFLSRGYRTVVESLTEEGWASAAFVSSAAVAAGSGLEQGFRVFDDDFVPGPAGTGRLLVLQDLLLLAELAGMPSPWRGAESTARRASTWVRAHGERPFVVWVHLADPSRRGAESLADIDAAIDELVEAVDERGVFDRTMWVVAGSHGALRGAHGGQGHHSLYDEVVRVPLVIRWPGEQAPKKPVVDAQVRLMDLATTAAVGMGLDELDGTEGVELSGYPSGRRTATISSTLVGFDAEGRWLLGLRNNGLKVIRTDDEVDALFELGRDPGETKDLAAEQSKALLSAQRLLAPDQVALDKLL